MNTGKFSVLDTDNNNKKKHKRVHSMSLNDNKLDSKQSYNSIEDKLINYNTNRKTKSPLPDKTKEITKDKKNIKPIQNVLSICSKKTPDETIQILETVLGKNTVQRTGNKVKLS